ncbi:hypothetical protein ACFL2Q_02335 [Thermodesulfobacteriota bacterium]
MSKKPASKKKDKKKTAQVDEPTTTEEKTEVEMIQSDPVESSPKKKRKPKMSAKEVWLLYGDVHRSANGDQVFDILARSFETRGDLGYWLYRAGHRDKIKLGKGRDFVQYFRSVAHSLFDDTRKEAR